jgi:hypothetical protein
MLSEYEKESKKESFLRKRIEELAAVANTDKIAIPEKNKAMATMLLQLAEGNFEGVPVEYRDKEYTIKSVDGSICNVPSTYFPDYYNRNFVLIVMYKNKCKYAIKAYEDVPYVVSAIVKNFTLLEKEYLQFSDELDKSDKITDVSINSIKTWLKELLRDSGYTYYTEESDNKIILSVKMKNGTQLNVPIYNKRFQKIMPELMNVIKEYEKLIDEKGVKVLISNAKSKDKWVNK